MAALDRAEAVLGAHMWLRACEHEGLETYVRFFIWRNLEGAHVHEEILDRILGLSLGCYVEVDCGEILLASWCL